MFLCRAPLPSNELLPSTSPASLRWKYNGTFDTSSPNFPIQLDADRMVVHAAAGVSLRLLLEFLAKARLVTCTCLSSPAHPHFALAPGQPISMLPHLVVQARGAPVKEKMPNG